MFARQILDERQVIMTDIELMEQCMIDGDKAFKAFINQKEDDGRHKYTWTQSNWHEVVTHLAVELFNFRSERMGMQLKATGIPADDIPF